MIRVFSVSTRIGVVGLLINRHAWWIGAHYSTGNARLCVNLVPCVTVWWTRPGGITP